MSRLGGVQHYVAFGRCTAPCRVWAVYSAMSSLGGVQRPKMRVSGTPPKSDVALYTAQTRSEVLWNGGIDFFYFKREFFHALWTISITTKIGPQITSKSLNNLQNIFKLFGRFFFISTTKPFTTFLSVSYLTKKFVNLF